LNADRETLNAFSRYSGCPFAALITLAHLTFSALVYRANSSGVERLITSP